MKNITKTGQLIFEARAGSRRAFERLVRLQTDRLLRVAWRIVCDAELARDIVQDAFLRVLDERTPFQDKGSGDAWLLRITTRLAIDAERSNKARRKRERRHVMEGQSQTEQPVERIMQDEQKAQVNAAFMDLPVDIRVPLWLNLVEGVSVRDVAVAIDSSRSSVSRSIRDGLARMKGWLEKRKFSLPAVLPLKSLLLEHEAPKATEALYARMENLWSTRPVPHVDAMPKRMLPRLAALGGLVASAVIIAFFAGGLFPWGNSDGGPSSADKAMNNAMEKAAVSRPTSPAMQETTAGQASENRESPDKLPAAEEKNDASEQESGKSPWNDADKLAALSGRVTCNGAAVDNIEVQLKPLPVNAMPQLVPHSKTLHATRTQRRGIFTFRRIPPGRYRIMAASETGAGCLMPIVVRKGDKYLTALNVELTPGRQVTGRLKTEDGKPLPPTSRLVYWAIEQKSQFFWRNELAIGPDGAFKLGPVFRNYSDPEHFFLAVPGYRLGKIKGWGGGGAVEVELLSAVALEGKVVDGDGAPVKAAVVKAFACRQMPHGATNCRLVEKTHTGNDGTFRLSSLPPDKVGLRIEARGFITPELIRPQFNGPLTRIEAVKLEKGHTIRGKVCRMGEPVPGAMVYLSSGDLQQNERISFFDAESLSRIDPGVAMLAADSNGCFETAPFPQGKRIKLSSLMAVIFKHPPKEKNPLLVEALAGEKDIIVPLAGKRPAINGEVVRQNGRPVPFAPLKVAMEGGGRPLVLPLRADQSGRFELNDFLFPPGVGKFMWVEAMDAHGNKGKLEVPEHADGEKQAFLKIIVKGGGGISGTVLGPDGKALSGVSVHVSRHMERDVTLHTDRQGKFQFSHDNIEKVTSLTIKHPGYATVRRFHLKENPIVSVQLAPEARIRVAVEDRKGKGVERAQIKVTKHGNDDKTWDRHVRELGKGLYEISGLPAGTYSMEAFINIKRGKWLTMPGKKIELSAGSHVKDYTLQLSRKVRLVGHVRDTRTGKGIQGAQVLPYSEDASAAARTDGQGYFALEGFPAGTFHVSFKAEGYSGDTYTVTFNGVSDEEISIELQPKNRKTRSIDREKSSGQAEGVLMGRVTDERGAPVPGAKVRRAHADDHSTWHSQTTDDNGCYRFEKLQPGGYLVEAECDKQPLRFTGRLKAHVGQAGETRVDVQMKRFAVQPLSITGRVEEEDGSPIEGVSVYFGVPFALEGKRLRRLKLFVDDQTVQTNAHGRFLLEGACEAGTITRLDISCWKHTETLSYHKKLRITDLNDPSLRIALKRRAKCKVRLEVKKADGTAAPNFKYFIYPPGKGGGGSICQDRRGIIEKTVISGSCILIATESHPDIKTKIVGQPGERIELTLSPKPPGRVEGELVDDHGEPLSGIKVGLDADSGSSFNRLGCRSTLHTVTDETGRFSMNRVPPGEYRLLVRGSDREPLVVEVKSGQAETIRVAK